MKKILAILLMAVVVFAVAGCDMFGGKDEKTIPVGVYVAETESEGTLKLKVVDSQTIIALAEEGEENEEVTYLHKTSHKEKEIFELIVFSDGMPGSAGMFLYDKEAKTIEILGQKLVFSEELTKAENSKDASALSEESSEAASEDTSAEASTAE